MNKIKSFFIAIYRIVTVFSIGFVTWKIVRYWHSGRAEKCGHGIDSSIGSAAEKLEKAAITLEGISDSGAGQKVGKNLDDVLTDTKKTLENVTNLVKRAAKPR